MVKKVALDFHVGLDDNINLDMLDTVPSYKRLGSKVIIFPDRALRR